MISGKQRAFLRKMGQTVHPAMQIGKEGLSDAVIASLDQTLEKRELVKVSILENAALNTRAVCDEAARRLYAEPVQAIGKKFVIYRQSHNEKNVKIELPKK